jgi:hypothetical protein
MDSAIGSLSTISEFSIGMGGFSGIVAVVAGSSRGWSNAAKFRAGNLIMLSIIPGLSALTALGLAQYIHGDSLWQVSCGILAGAATTFTAFHVKRSSAAFGSIFSFSNPLNTVIWMLYMANLGLQLAGASGMLERFAFATFYGGLVFHLAVAALNFYRLVFPPASDSDYAWPTVETDFPALHFNFLSKENSEPLESLVRE